MRVVCLRCTKITKTKVIPQWVFLKKDDENDCYRGICARCGAEMILESIESVEKTIKQAAEKRS